MNLQILTRYKNNLRDEAEMKVIVRVIGQYQWQD